MSLRRISYGYEVRNGRNVVVEDEAAVVCYIFSEYIKGKSLKTIAIELTERGVVYYFDKKIWTKNLIARIIANPQYTGVDGFPSIISKVQFDMADNRRLDMSRAQAELPEITALIKSKFVCSGCGRNMGRRNKWKNREKWLCPGGCKVDIYIGDREIFSALLRILNRVRNNPELLRLNTTPVEYSPSMEVIRQNKEIERVKEQTGVEFGVLSKMLLKCVEYKYECCSLDRSRAMTEALMDEYRRLPQITELDVTLIRETVQKIAVNRDGTLTVTFINLAEVTNIETEDRTA